MQARETQIIMQSLALRACAPARLRVEHGITVIRDAVEHECLAGATGALPAGREHPDTDLLGGVEEGLVRRDGEGQPALGGVDLDGAVENSHRRALTPAVDESPVGACGVGGSDHGQDRGDADAASDEQVARGVHEREVIAGPADPNGVAVLKLVVDVEGSATAVRVAQDAQAEGAPVGQVAAQGVLAGGGMGEDEVDVRAGLPRGSGWPLSACRVSATTPFATICLLVTTTSTTADRADSDPDEPDDQECGADDAANRPALNPDVRPPSGRAEQARDHGPDRHRQNQM